MSQAAIHEGPVYRSKERITPTVGNSIAARGLGCHPRFRGWLLSVLLRALGVGFEPGALVV
ncbi:MAG TPA: hypothetical protein PLJ27_04630 [Polyangiaceae bacterium]|nr:MAG: hypothetical protein BWY17_02543 [Deltaproteobacteria bacterium ADurb.Bin207]HNS95505.1 hypothetical protein [Polyangiaceae bacterium]HNZ23606.1 hypothetical protein [Polyangiaceae bacterium]HOD22696.1 hypothetical protein [Polyangiaceae bacterium]HOE47752.1 hypothetical protein [Polyangiaceae bacterium]